MNSLVLLLCLLAAALPLAGQATAAAPQSSPQLALEPEELKVECLPASRAAELEGSTGCVAGRVFSVRTAKSGNLSLSLCPPKSPCHFHAVVEKKDLAILKGLPPLRGRLLAVSGPVRDYRGHPRMKLREQQQLRLTAGDAPKEFDATQPAGVVKTNAHRRRAW